LKKTLQGNHGINILSKENLFPVKDCLKFFNVTIQKGLVELQVGDGMRVLRK